jgi:hypothetical protein
MVNQASLTAVVLACLAVTACRVDTKGIGEVGGDAGGGGRRDASGDGVKDAPPVTDGPASEAPPGEDDAGNAMGPGAECTTGIECLSGVCSEGICCDSACTGDCEACNVAGSVGTCVPLKGPPRPGRPPCLGEGTPCAGACDGVNRDACQYPAGEATCKAASCADGKGVARAVCSGGGVCLPALEVSCAPYACDGAICAGGCSEARPCTAGNYCNAGRCMPLLAAGEACNAGDQCATGFCTDGRCCGQKACGACEACTGTNGVCVKLTGGSDPDSCAGVCTASGCRKPTGQACSNGNECVTGFCADGRCCNRACTAACEACNLAGALGTCGPSDLTRDPANCGSCGTRCSTNHVAAVCTAGKCSGACQTGWADCNANKTTDGCEVNLASNAQNCGACGTTCPGTRCLGSSCEKIELTWSSAGPAPGPFCVHFDEPSDPHTWFDNHLCTQRDFGLRWSLAGPIAGMVCIVINEPSDPDQWADNHLCAPVDYGLRWSIAGPIAGMRCTLINEPAEPVLEAWGDNYLCAP